MKSGAVHFEAIKAGLSQNKDGLVLRIVVHPNDVPPEVLSAPVGSRWVVAIADIPENEASADADAGKRAVQLAGILCKNKVFWQYAGVRDEDKAVAYLKSRIGVASRSDLAHNPEAQKLLHAVNEEFQGWSDVRRS